MILLLCLCSSLKLQLVTERSECGEEKVSRQPIPASPSPVSHLILGFPDSQVTGSSLPSPSSHSLGLLRVRESN